MKKMIVALAAFGLAGALTACSDGGSEPKKQSKGELCAAGISTECLVGEWSMNGLALIDNGELHPSFNYSAAPGKLIFQDNGEYHYLMAAAAPAVIKDCDDGWGTWNVVNGVLTMKGTVGNTCIDGKTFPGSTAKMSPKVSVNGDKVVMVFDRLFYFLGAVDEAALKTQYGESYSIGASVK